MNVVAKQMELIVPLVQRLDALVCDGRRPADVALAQLWREHREWGARDRRFFGDAVFAFFRWRGWLAGLLPERWTTAVATACWLDALPHPAALEILKQAGLTAPFAATLSDKARALVEMLEMPTPFLSAQLVPPWVPERLVQPDDVSPAAAQAQLFACFQSRPSLWLRVAPQAVPAVLAWLNQPVIRAAAHPALTEAVRVDGAVDLNGLRKAVGAVFEVQDLSSQCVGRVCAPEPGARWWDACAGAGGKALHLAALMHNRGTILATDVRAAALAELRRRAAAASVTIIRTRPSEHEPFDGVLVDAPCSGLGTWNRNPDMRWRTEAAVVDACAATQRQLLAQAAPRVRPGGILVYAVCTVTRSETTDLVGDFLSGHPEFQPDRFPHPLTGREAHGAAWVWPWDGPCGGMFIARLRRAVG